MSIEVDPGVEAPSDAELIEAVRAGDNDAYGELLLRHVEAARRLGRQLVSAGDVDDLVSEAFAKVLTALQLGDGPELAFRAYLLTSVRRLHTEKVRVGKRVQPADDLDPYDAGVPFRDTAVEEFESEVAAKAFASLPERWQMVLWHTEVERMKPAAIAPLLGISPSSVSALAHRAREGLRQACISCHAGDIVDERCEWSRENLGAYIRSGLRRREAGRLKSHLGGCRRCTAIYIELTGFNANLGAVLAPLLLGSAAGAYLKGGVVIGAASGGIRGAVLWLQNVVRRPTGATTTAGVVVAAAAAGAFALTLGVTPAPQADPPAAAVPPPAPGSGGGGGGGGGAGGGGAAPAPPVDVVPAPTLRRKPTAQPVGDAQRRPVKKQGASDDSPGTPTSTPQAPTTPSVTPKPAPGVELPELTDRLRRLLIGDCKGSGGPSLLCNLADTTAGTSKLLHGTTQQLKLADLLGAR